MTANSAPAGETRWLDGAEQRAWLALLEVGSGLFDTLSAGLKAIAQLTLDDYEVLHLLSQADGRRMRIGELADAMLTGRTRLSQRVDRLGDRGWVERARCSDDGRVIWVALTDDGAELLERIAPHHLEHVRRHVFDHLTPTDVDHLARSLGKIARHLHHERRR